MSFHIGGDSQKTGWVFSVSWSNILLYMIRLMGGNSAGSQAKVGIGFLLIDKRQGVNSKLSITWRSSGVTFLLVWKGRQLSLYDVFLSSLFSAFLPVCAAA